jgi:hypothetical protein
VSKPFCPFTKSQKSGKISRNKNKNIYMAENEKDSGKAEMPENPLDKAPEAPKQEGAKLVKSIVDTETSTGEKAILEEAPEVDLSLIQDIEAPKSLPLLLLKSLFGILVVASAASLLFFTSQLSNKLDFASSTFNIPNVSKELTSSNSEITKLQTSYNFYRYLQLKAYLDEFSYYGDSYAKYYEIANSQTANNADIREAAEYMVFLDDNLRDSFMNTKEIMTKSFTAPLFSEEITDDAALYKVFVDELKMELTQKANEFSNSEDDQAKREFKNYSQTTNLAGNVSLQNLVIQTDYDALSESDLYDLINKVNSLVVNDLSTIQTIKENRIKWSDIMNEIYLRTVAVDTYHSGSYFDELGGIRYTSYDLDSSGPSISIVGETKRFDTTNFTMIVNLIDELNASDLFKDAEMRSFAKSGNADSGYTASIKLNLGLEEMAEPVETAAVVSNDAPAPEDAPFF